LRRLGGTPSPLILKSMVALKFSGVVGRLPWTLFPPPAFTPLFQPTARLSNRQKAQPCRNSIGTHAATLRRSIAAAVNELSAERRPVLTEDQVRAMIGGGAEKRVERTFGAVEDFTDRSVCCLNDERESCYYFCKVWLQYHRVPFSTIAPRILPMVTGI
jgi:hypothetical protein